MTTFNAWTEVVDVESSSPVAFQRYTFLIEILQIVFHSSKMNAAYYNMRERSAFCNTQHYVEQPYEMDN